MTDKIVQKEEPIAASHAGIAGLGTGTLQLTFREGITAKSVHDALDRIFKLHGCLACGFHGLDIRLQVVDPALRQVQGIEGVVNANFTH